MPRQHNTATPDDTIDFTMEFCGTCRQDDDGNWTVLFTCQQLPTRDVALFVRDQLEGRIMEISKGRLSS